jgi:hypothetical protein
MPVFGWVRIIRNEGGPPHAGNAMKIITLVTIENNPDLNFVFI